jgi:hypothetical protein
MATLSASEFLRSTMTDEDWLSRRRDKILQGADSNIYLHLGYFLSSFSRAELALTAVLAIVAKAGSLETFEILCSGLMPKQKVERLQRLVKNTHRKIGPNLLYFLDCEFKGKIIPLRKDLSHCHLTKSKTPGMYVIRTLSKRDGKGARTIKALELFRLGLWLEDFSTDLLDVLGSLQSHPKILEIGSPRNPIGPVPSSRPDQPKPAASGGRRARKRERKGLTPRGKATQV